MELIVVDDSGEGHAKPVIKNISFTELDLTYIPKCKNEGLVLARETGIKNSDGKYVHFLDDDDQLLPGAIKRKIQVAKKTDSGVVYSGLYLDGDRAVLPSSDCKGNVLQRALTFDLSPCIPSTMLVREDLLDEINFEEIANKGLHNEHAMQIQLAQSTTYGFVDQPLLIRDTAHESRGGSKESIKEYDRIFNEYNNIYYQYPPETRNRAFAYIQFLYGNLYVNSTLWSSSAIIKFAQATYSEPSFHLIYLSAF
jgi:glycosyltransferase involved in cell wall biosynthesis